MVFVNLKEDVKAETLEKVLLNTAKVLGFRAISIDKFEKEYNLGSVKEVDKYQSTEIILLKPKPIEPKYGLLTKVMRFFKQDKIQTTTEAWKESIKLRLYKDRRNVDHFVIDPINETQEGVKQYLSRVSIYLDRIQ